MKIMFSVLITLMDQTQTLTLKQTKKNPHKYLICMDPFCENKTTTDKIEQAQMSQ